MTVRESVIKALDDAFCDGIKNLYSVAVAKVTGGEPADQVMKEFDVGFALEVAKLHNRVIKEVDDLLAEEGIA